MDNFVRYSVQYKLFNVLYCVIVKRKQEKNVRSRDISVWPTEEINVYKLILVSYKFLI